MSEFMDEVNKKIYKSSKDDLLNKYNTGEMSSEEYLEILNKVAKKTKQTGQYNSEFERVTNKENQSVADTKSENFMTELVEYTKDQDAKRENFALEERDYQRGLAEKSDADKQAIVSDMLKDADISDAEYEEEIGKSSSAVKQAFANSHDSNIRDVRRMGLNPISGRAGALSKRAELTEGATVAGAENQTRTGLKMFSENKKDNARRVDLGLNPLALNVQDKRIFMPGQTGGALNSGAGFYGNKAGRLQGQRNFNRNMDFQLKQWNDRPKAPSFGEQLAIGAIGGLSTAGGLYAGKKWG